MTNGLPEFTAPAATPEPTDHLAEQTLEGGVTHKPRFDWFKDKRVPGLRLHLKNRYWYLNTRVGNVILSERTPFKENQRMLARKFRDDRVAQERKRQLAFNNQLGGARLNYWRDVIDIWNYRLDNDAAIVEKTKIAHRCRLQAVLESWEKLFKAPLAEMRLDAVSEDLLIGWHGHFRADYSADYTNKCRSVLIGLWNIAMKRSNFSSVNLAANLPQLSVQRQTLRLPSRAEFWRLIEVIRATRDVNCNADNVADFLLGIVYTGLRLEEASLLRTEHVKFSTSSETGATTAWLSLPAEIVKGRKRARVVPIQPVAIPLFQKLVANAEPETRSVFKIRSARKTLKRACEKICIPVLTHHDFRHLFATLAYEATGNAPLVAAWLGHGDGGILVHKVYNHVREEFAAEQAAKLDFKLEPKTDAPPTEKTGL